MPGYGETYVHPCVCSYAPTLIRRSNGKAAGQRPIKRPPHHPPSSAKSFTGTVEDSSHARNTRAILASTAKPTRTTYTSSTCDAGVSKDSKIPRYCVDSSAGCRSLHLKLMQRTVLFFFASVRVVPSNSYTKKIHCPHDKSTRPSWSFELVLARTHILARVATSPLVLAPLVDPPR